MTTLAPQHITALQKANRIRIERAGLKRSLHDTQHRVVALRLAADAILASPDYADTMLVLDVIRACYRMGGLTARHVLRDTGLSETVTVGALTDRQRGVIVSHLRLLAGAR